MQVDADTDVPVVLYAAARTTPPPVGQLYIFVFRVASRAQRGRRKSLVSDDQGALVGFALVGHLPAKLTKTHIEDRRVQSAFLFYLLARLPHGTGCTSCQKGNPTFAKHHLTVVNF